MSASSRNGHLEDDHSDGDSLISVTSEEFPHYFIEREGRLFHSSPTAPYPLPVDTPEQERLNVQHEALLRVIGRHYVGPVPQALVSEDDVTKCVVDFCCGNGRWVLDMASQFPEVSFIGLDIVPIATRNPPANVMFEIHDIQSPTRFPDGSVDCVHARFCSMAVRDYDLLVREASRILRPGGVFVFGEMLRLAVFHPTVVDQNPRVAVPNFCTFYDLLNERLRRHGIQHVSDSVPLRLGNIGTFSEITPIAYNLPIGSWHEDEYYRSIGRAYRSVLRRFMESVRLFILELGIPPEELHNVYSQAHREIVDANAHRLVTRYFTGFAIRANT